MTFRMMRLIIELGLSFHFFLKLRLAFGGGWWQVPVLLGLGLMLVPMFPQGRDLIPGPVLDFVLKFSPLWTGYLICFTLLAVFMDLTRLTMTPFSALAHISWLKTPLMIILPLLTLIFLAGGMGVTANAPAVLREALKPVAPFWPLLLLITILYFLNLGVEHWKPAHPALADFSWWKFFAAKRAVPATLILALVFTGYGYYEAYHPRLTRLSIKTEKLPAGVEKLRLVQLSDVHLSNFIGLKELENIVGLVKEAGPDILVVTGDLVDADMSARGREAELLAAIKPPYGSFGVLGNHELYRGTGNSISFYRLSGLKLLRGEAVEAGGIVIAGMDDEAFGNSGNKTPLDQLLRTFNDGPRFVLFLKHRPQLAPGTAGLFDLQLSGHTHGGQIWPGHFLIGRANGVVSGLHSVPGEARGLVYTSRGTGFWGLPMRLLAWPEVTVIDLVNKSPDTAVARP